MIIEKFKVYLESKKQLTQNKVSHFVFKRVDGKKTKFTAGQFVSLYIPKNDDFVRRSFSVANAPKDSEIIELACSYIPGGLASEKLFNMEQGQELNISGPYGKFVLEPQVEPKRYILVATGTGVTPYRSMLPELLEKIEAANVEIVLLFGCRAREDLLYADEFVDAMKKYPNFKYIPCFSREDDKNLLKHECLGYVQDCFNNLELNKDTDLVYLCGNPTMVEMAEQKLQDLGLELSNIRREKYVAAK